MAPVRHLRGKGLGMGLLAESLARIDALGASADLESSNPANIARYERTGFTARDAITTATGHVVITMWRPGPKRRPELHKQTLTRSLLAHGLKAATTSVNT